MDNEIKYDLYYYSENGNVLGPFELEELQGKIKPDTLIFIEDGIKWNKAAEIPELDIILNPPTPIEEVFPLEDSVLQDHPELIDSAHLEDQSVLIPLEDIIEPSSSINLVKDVENSTPSINSGKTEELTASVPKKSETGKVVFWIVLVILLVGLVGVTLNLSKIKEYYKWKEAEEKFSYVSSLKVRTDTTRSSDFNVLVSLRYGQSIKVISDPKIAPWCEAKIQDDYTGNKTYGFLNSFFLMRKMDFKILESLFNDNAPQSVEANGNVIENTSEKYKQISEARYRKSLVDYVKTKYDYSSFDKVEANTVDTMPSSNYNSRSTKPILWAGFYNQYSGYYNQFIKTGANKYIRSELDGQYISRDYAMFQLELEGSDAPIIETVIFIYENGFQIASKSFQSEPSRETCNSFLNYYGLYY